MKAKAPKVRKKVPFQAMVDEDALVVALDPIDVEILLGALKMAKIARGGARLLLGVKIPTPEVDDRERKLVVLLTDALRN
jgi:hypothetical protein